MPKFRVELIRVEHNKAVIEVDAEDENDAYDVANEQVSDKDWDTTSANQSVEFCEKLEGKPDDGWQEAYARLAARDGVDFLEHDHGMDH